MFKKWLQTLASWMQGEAHEFTTGYEYVRYDIGTQVSRWSSGM
jgi:hypothetical protein